MILFIFVQLMANCMSACFNEVITVGGLCFYSTSIVFTTAVLYIMECIHIRNCSHQSFLPFLIVSVVLLVFAIILSNIHHSLLYLSVIIEMIFTILFLFPWNRYFPSKRVFQSNKAGKRKVISPFILIGFAYHFLLVIIFAIMIIRKV